MGVDYYSYLIVGCEIDEDKLKIKRKERKCQCNVKDIENAQYCSECGEEAWREEWDPVEGYDEMDDEFLGLPIVHNTDYKNCWIAIHKEDVGNHGSFDAVKLETPKDMEELKAKLKAKLEPRDLWNEESFGVWAIQFISY